MGNRNATAIGIMSLVVVCVSLGFYFDPRITTLAALGVLLLAAGIEVFYHFQRQSLLKSLRAMDEEEQSAYLELIRQKGSTGDLREILTPQLTLRGKVLSAILSVAFLFGPPLAYHLWFGLELSWNAPFTGMHLLCMFLGVGVYFAFRDRMLARYMERTEDLVLADRLKDEKRG